MTNMIPIDASVEYGENLRCLKIVCAWNILYNEKLKMWISTFFLFFVHVRQESSPLGPIVTDENIEWNVRVFAIIISLVITIVSCGPLVSSYAEKRKICRCFVSCNNITIDSNHRVIVLLKTVFLLFKISVIFISPIVVSVENVAAHPNFTARIFLATAAAFSVFSLFIITFTLNVRHVWYVDMISSRIFSSNSVCIHQ